jgi:hypothetical protein
MTIRPLFLTLVFIAILSPAFAQTEIMPTQTATDNANVLNHWNHMSSTERRQAVREQREQQKQQVQTWKSMTPEQRRAQFDNMRTLNQAVTPGQKPNLQPTQQDLQQMKDAGPRDSGIAVNGIPTQGQPNDNNSTDENRD